MHETFSDVDNSRRWFRQKKNAVIRFPITIQILKRHIHASANIGRVYIRTEHSIGEIKK